jgi:hypothetical protein
MPAQTLEGVAASRGPLTSARIIGDSRSWCVPGRKTGGRGKSVSELSEVNVPLQALISRVLA